MDLRRPWLPLPAAALVPSHAVRGGCGLSPGLGTGTLAPSPPAPRQDLPAQPHLLHQRGLGQRGLELRAAGRGAGGGYHHPTGHPAAVGAAGGPAASPPAIRRHGARLRRGRLQHRRRPPLLPARLRLPPGRHRPPRPQVHTAESAAAGGPSGRPVPALPDLPAQLLPALRGGRGAGAGSLLGGRPALRRHPLGLRPAQLPELRPLQPGHLLRPLPHLRPHRPRPGQPHRGGQPAPLPPALRQPPERAQLPGHRADAGRHVHVPAAGPYCHALGGTAATGTPPEGVGATGDGADGETGQAQVCWCARPCAHGCAGVHGPVCTGVLVYMCWCAWPCAHTCAGVHGPVSTRVYWCARLYVCTCVLVCMARRTWECADLHNSVHTCAGVYKSVCMWAGVHMCASVHGSVNTCAAVHTGVCCLYVCWFAQLCTHTRADVHSCVCTCAGVHSCMHMCASVHGTLHAGVLCSQSCVHMCLLECTASCVRVMVCT